MTMVSGNNPEEFHSRLASRCAARRAGQADGLTAASGARSLRHSRKVLPENAFR